MGRELVFNSYNLATLSRRRRKGGSERREIAAPLLARWSSNVNATQTQSYTPREDEAAVAERDSRKRDDFHRDFGVDSRERGEHLLEHIPGIEME